MRILLDECIDWRLSRDLTGHAVSTVRKMGWSSLTNGALMRQAAEGGFEAFLTVDRNLPQQQNLSGIALAVIVLRTRTIRLKDLRPLVPGVLSALAVVKPGTVTTIG